MFDISTPFSPRYHYPRHVGKIHVPKLCIEIRLTQKTSQYTSRNFENVILFFQVKFPVGIVSNNTGSHITNNTQ
jgi:hypothetical protein